VVFKRGSLSEEEGVAVNGEQTLHVLHRHWTGSEAFHHLPLFGRLIGTLRERSELPEEKLVLPD
jgi:hypothetical protein